MKRRYDVMLALLLALAWGCYWPAMKRALGEMDVWLFRSSSGLVGGLTFLLTLGSRGLSLRVARTDWRPLASTALLNMTLCPLCSLLALRFYAAGSSVIVAYTMPVWVALFTVATRRERLSGRFFAALGLGLLGLTALVSNDIRTAGGFPAGALLVLSGAAAWAVGVMLQKYTAWKTDVAVVTAWQLVLGTLPFVPVSLAVSNFSAFGHLSLAASFAWLYSTFIGFVLGNYLFYRIIARLPASTAATISLGVPVCGVLASAVALGERIGPADIAALAFIVAAVGLVLIKSEPDAGAKHELKNNQNDTTRQCGDENARAFAGRLLRWGFDQRRSKGEPAGSDQIDDQRNQHDFDGRAWQAKRDDQWHRQDAGIEHGADRAGGRAGRICRKSGGQ